MRCSRRIKEVFRYMFDGEDYETSKTCGEYLDEYLFSKYIHKVWFLLLWNFV